MEHRQLASYGAVVISAWYLLLSGVLDEDLDDTLINVNLLDDERAAKNVENKKKKPGYQAYDDSEFNEYGMVCVWCFLALIWLICVCFFVILHRGPQKRATFIFRIALWNIGRF